MAVSTYLSMITLNVNKLNSLIKRHKMADWIEKEREKKKRPFNIQPTRHLLQS